MSSQVTITLINGRVIHGVNYRMSATAPSGTGGLKPSVPDALTGGVYHIEDENGWVDIPANQVASITAHPGRPT